MTEERLASSWWNETGLNVAIVATKTPPNKKKNIPICLQIHTELSHIHIYIYTYIHKHSRKQDPAPKAYRLVATETTETQRQKKHAYMPIKTHTELAGIIYIYIVGN